MQFKRVSILFNAQRLTLVLLLLSFGIQQSVLCAADIPQYKVAVSYQLPAAQSIKLRVVKIPTEYPWIERDEQWQVKLPEIGSTVIAENIEDIKLTDAYGAVATIPAGSKFYAKLTSSQEPKSFWRKGHVELSFDKLEVANHAIDLSKLEFNSRDKVNVVGDGLKNVAVTGAMAVAGAVAAPLIVFNISSLLGKAFLTNPYVLGGTAAVGAGVGLVYGIKRQGQAFIIEPGTELKLELKEPWLMAEQLEVAPDSPNSLPLNKDEIVSAKRLALSDKLKLNILKVSKARDDFGDTCLRISVNYDNQTNEELRYMSFQLVDSMGKEYEPSLTSYTNAGKLPKQGTLDLYFPSDFPKTVHQLKVLRYQDQRVLAQEKIVLK